MNCEANGCRRRAVFRCYWPGQTVCFCFCEAHKDVAERTAEAMGFDLAVEFVDQAAYDGAAATGHD